MSPRKLVNKDDDDISSRKQQKKEKRQEDDIRSDRDDEEELSPTLSPSTRGKRRREREKKARPREMTEEEMMDLALRLSEHEASVAALRRQQEEDAMMKAMEESMGSQTQPCPPSQSQSLIANTDTSSTLPSRRKLFYPAVMGASARKPGVSVESCTVEADLRQEPKRVEDENNNKKKRKRKDGSPLPEMPDLSQTQKIYSQASPSSTPSLTVPSHPTQANGIDPDDEDVESTPTHYVRLAMPSKSDNEEEKNDISKELNRAKTELSSDMTLRWSDDDDDTVSGLSPSPIFPEERPLHQPDDQKVSPGPPSPSRSPKHLRCSPVPDTRGVQGLSSFTHETHGSNKQNLPGPSSSSSSKPTSGQQRPETSDRQTATTEGEPRPVQDQGAHSEASDPPGEACGGATVHYYWGVPFCPHGLDPDTYTQVILAQMEVYEKSLKQAQRGLLRKAEWGEAILPEPEKSPMSVSPAESPQLPTSLRRGLRLRGKTASEKISTPPPEEEEEDDKDEGEGQKERDNGNDEEEVDIGDGDVCPETQLSGDDDSTQDLIIASPTGEQPQPKSPSLPELQTSLQTQERQRREEEKEEEEQEQEEVMEVDGQDVRMETEEERSDPEVAGEEEEEEEKKEKDEDDVPQMPVPADPGPAGAPQSPVHNVDCPICQGSFSVTEIELHAAYCDGEGDVAEAVRRTAKEDHIQVSLVPRRKRTRRGVLIGEEKTDPSDLDKTAQRREKCYVCQKTVLLSEYNRHTEVCIQRRSSKTALRGDLLSALQHTDSRGSEAGPSGSNLHCGPGEVIDLRFSEDESGDGESEDASAFRISNSPIRAFTPISEAADCLVDFKQQHSAKQPSQRRRGGGRGGGGFKRKFKQ